MIIRKKVALSVPSHSSEGALCPVFVPDFSFDDKLYSEAQGLNEISIALSNHSLADSVRMRLQEFSPPPSITEGLSDSQILDNMIPSEMSTSTLMSLAHDLENDILNPKQD